MKIVALMPLKANSQRVPGKNFKLFNDKPLYMWTLDTLLSVPDIESVIINTDAERELREAGFKENKKVLIRERRQEICGDLVSMNTIIADDLNSVDADLYIMTHTTNPLLTKDTIIKAIELFKQYVVNGSYDSLFSVNKIQTRFYRADGSAVNHDPTKLIQTQDLEPWFEENSNLYLFTPTSFSLTKARIGKRPFLFESPLLESCDIDTPSDWERTEALSKLLNNNS